MLSDFVSLNTVSVRHVQTGTALTAVIGARAIRIGNRSVCFTLM